jgi:pimeloyl-ACP methyl ester carboxylesterase
MGDPATLAEAGRGLSEFRGDALVAWGSEDGSLGPDWAGAYAERLPGAEAEVVPGAGHWLWLDHADVVDRVSGFLR